VWLLGRDYGHDVFLHLQEALKRIDFFVAELERERRERWRVEKELNERIETLEKENAALRLENARLRGMIDKNSGNSSKPPSSDGFKRIFNSREKTGRAPGGQPGHKGHGPKLYDNPNAIVEIKEETCACGGRYAYTESYRAKQLVDIRIEPDVTEYRVYQGKCDCCGGRSDNRAPISDMLSYGPKLRGLAALLSLEGCVSLNRLTRIISELTCGSIALSQGTVVSWLWDLSGKVASAVDSIKDKLLLSPVLHKDETGIWINGKLQWLHVLSTEKHTLYHADKKRGNDADRAMDILPAYGGTLVHDHLKGLYEFPCAHAECNVHILRYLKSAVERKKRKWAEDMIGLLMEAKGLKDAQPDGKLTPEQIEEIQRRYTEIIQAGHDEYQPDQDYNGEDMKLLRRMEKFKAEHLRFITDPAVPFDNNQAERDLRMIKAKQKISGTFRAPDGGTVFATLKSFSATVKKHNFNLWQALSFAFRGWFVAVG